MTVGPCLGSETVRTWLLATSFCTPLQSTGCSADAALPTGRSGAWPMVQGAIAIDARLALIEQATTSLDLQY